MGNPGMQGLAAWGSGAYAPRLAMGTAGMQGVYARLRNLRLRGLGTQAGDGQSWNARLRYL